MKTFGKTRRDPQQGKNGFSTQRGFTLIELMLVIAVVAIITSFALPSYRTLIEKRQVTSGAEQLAGFISTAQIEAVKRSENITVSFTRTASDTWCVGMVSGTTACDCTLTPGTEDCLIDSQVRIFNQDNFNYPDIMQPQSDWAFTYDPARGLQQPPNPVDLKLLSEDNTYSMNVEVSVTGRVKICNDASANIKVPGFKSC